MMCNKIIGLVILLLIFGISCNKQDATKEVKEFPKLTIEKKKVYTSIIKEYQISDLEVTADTEHLSHVNSILEQSLKFIKDGETEELMRLLDENKKDIYSLPTNNVFSLMGDFNDMLLDLYKCCLSTNEALAKEIEIRKQRALFCDSLMALKAMEGETIDDYFEYIKIYSEENLALMNLYKKTGETEKEKQCVATLRQIQEVLEQP